MMIYTLHQSDQTPRTSSAVSNDRVFISLDPVSKPERRPVPPLHPSGL